MKLTFAKSFAAGLVALLISDGLSPVLAGKGKSKGEKSGKSGKAGGHFANKVAGGYFLTQEFDGSFSSFRQVIISEDGGISAIDSSQSAGAVTTAFSFSSQLGVWEQSGHHQLTAKVINFRYPLTPEATKATTLATYILNFDNYFQEVSGTIELKSYADEVNPLDEPDAGVVVGTLNFVGQQLTC